MASSSARKRQNGDVWQIDSERGSERVRERKFNWRLLLNDRPMAASICHALLFFASSSSSFFLSSCSCLIDFMIDLTNDDSFVRRPDSCLVFNPDPIKASKKVNVQRWMISYQCQGSRVVNRLSLSLSLFIDVEFCSLMKKNVSCHQDVILQDTHVEEMCWQERKKKNRPGISDQLTRSSYP